MYLDSDNAFYGVNCEEKPHSAVIDFGTLPSVMNSYVMVVNVWKCSIPQCQEREY